MSTSLSLLLRFASFCCLLLVDRCGRLIPFGLSFSALPQEAYKERWGEQVPGHSRAKILHKLADLIEANIDELAALESLDNGKAFAIAKAFDVSEAAACLRYYAGWCDKDGGKVIEVDESKFA